MSDQAPALPEVKATAHLMLFEPGAYCVFNTPGTAAPDAATGLPGARLSPSPSPGPYTGRITLTGFNADGWLAAKDDAALLRVSGGPALVLFTIYQDAAATHDPPKLQIMRLTQATTPAPAPELPAFKILAHQYGSGDVTAQFGEWIGERGSQRWLEGFALQPPLPASDIEYQAVLGRGWLSPWSEGGQFCGSRGMSLPILGLRVRLRGASAETHGVALSATFVDGTAVGPVTDGSACEAESLAALEAFQIALVPNSAPAKPARSRRGKR